MRKSLPGCSGNDLKKAAFGWALALLALGLIPACVGRSADDQVVAEYRGESLTLGQLRAYLPPNLAPADSQRASQLYIQQWQTEQALADAAEKQVPDLESRIEPRVADARRKIMIDELRAYLVKDESAALITPKMIEDYYKEHIEQFIASGFLFQYRYLTSYSKDLELLKQRIVSDQEQDTRFLLQWARQNAVEFRLDDQYMEGTVLMGIQAKVKQDLTSVEAKAEPFFFETESPKGPQYHLFYMRDIIRPGKYIPLEQVSDQIRQTLVFKRQNERIENFEQRVLQQARSSGHIR